MNFLITSGSLQPGAHRLILYGPVLEPEFYCHQQVQADFEKPSNRVIRIGRVVRLGL